MPPASKSLAQSSPGSKRGLLSRPLDCFYFAFYVFHLVNFVCIDGQSFWPTSIVPRALQQVKQDYLRDSGDPFLIAFDKGEPKYVWFSVSVYSSLVFQNPVFVAGVWAMWNGEHFDSSSTEAFSDLQRQMTNESTQSWPAMA
jgi:hypothetical protein